MAVLEVASLHVYPVKGCAGVELEQMEVDEHGPRFDREWMIVDARGAFVTQRQQPRLALIATRLVEGTLVLEAPGVGALELELGAADAAVASRQVQCWSDSVLADDCGNEAADWLDTFLGEAFRLVRVRPGEERDVDPAYAPRPATTRFSDGFPLLLIGAASLEALNERLDVPAEMRRFRPNIVVQGAAAHAEDAWRRVRIGAAEFDGVKACSRCSVTTVDPQTAERGSEPLATLASYRSARRIRPDGGSERVVLFGQNLVHSGPSTIGTGDRLEILEAIDPSAA